MLEGRWTIFVCTACGEATGRHKACDASREATPVVPVDDAAVERAARALCAESRSANPYEAFADVWNARALAALRAAGEQS